MVEVVVLGIIGLLEGFLYQVLGWIPSVDVPGMNSQAVAVVGEGWFQHLGWANDYFPLLDILAAATVVFTMWTSIRVFYVIMWILRSIHVVGGSS